MSENGGGIEAQRSKAMMLYREDVAPCLSVEMELKRVLASTESQYQKIDVIDTYFGKVGCVFRFFVLEAFFSI